LPVTFGTEENFCTKYLQFEVANINTTYHAIIGRSGLAKFMAIPNCTYLVLKMSGPNGVLVMKGNLKQSYTL
jgi:hypothetical protein